MALPDWVKDELERRNLPSWLKDAVDRRRDEDRQRASDGSAIKGKKGN
jgi:hypothetical protein